MNREKKFRAWDRVNKKYEYSGSMGTSEFTAFWMWVEHNNIKNVEQFTGLTDKNGKEIYEEDIVNVYGSIISGNQNEIIFIDTCEYKIFEAKYVFRNRNTDFGVEHSWGNRYEVIGNTYGNKDLLAH